MKPETAASHTAQQQEARDPQPHQTKMNRRLPATAAASTASASSPPPLQPRCPPLDGAEQRARRESSGGKQGVTIPEWRSMESLS
jgi:hypothetical protein